MFDGQVTVGGVLSTTVTVAEQLALFPLGSVTVRVTEFGPLLAHVNVLGVTVRVAMAQLSLLPLSTSAPVMVALPDAFSATVMFLHTAVGGIGSVTKNVVVHTVKLLLASLTVKMTLVVPVPTTVPGAGLCDTSSEPAGVQLSDATTWLVKFGRTA